MRKHLGGLLLGFGAFSLLEGGWWVFCKVNGRQDVWVMQPTLAIRWALVALFLLALTCSAISTEDGVAFAQFGSVATGVVLGLVVWLFVIGPGNVWPIVIAIDMAFILPTLFFGFFLARLGRRIARGAA